MQLTSSVLNNRAQFGINPYAHLAMSEAVLVLSAYSAESVVLLS